MIDSVLSHKFVYQYNSIYQLLNYKYYQYNNGNEYLTEYQYEYTAGASNKKQINYIDKIRGDYSEGSITEFLPWEHPVDMP